MEVINQHINLLKKLCVKFFVAELYIFGSMANGSFDDKSDIDLLVRFSDVPPLDYFDNYMNFKKEIETLYSRNVDLLEKQSLKNPVLKRSIDKNKIQLYG